MESKDTRLIQFILAGEEELMYRSSWLYAFKSFLNRRFGLFSTFTKKMEKYYQDKYPALKELKRTQKKPQ